LLPALLFAVTADDDDRFKFNESSQLFIRPHH
jgi:hypothetical protein